MGGKVIMMVGFQASGKSTIARDMQTKFPKSRVILSRDAEGGAVNDLLPKMEALIKEKKTVILDNTNLTVEARKPFIELAKKLGVPILAIHVKSSIEDCQVRLLRRMYEKYGELFYVAKTFKPSKGHPAEKDPGVFPPSVLFTARKRFEAPQVSEGFTSIKEVDAAPIRWDGRTYRNKAVFFDIDETLRKTEDLPLKYPTSPSEVKLYTDKSVMLTKINEYRKLGYHVIGVSNQSGIARGKVKEENVLACFHKTRELLDMTEQDMPISYCPHNPVPISCYCRKPQVGMPMEHILKKKLNPSKCLLVGDSKTDQTTAERLGMKYIHTEVFWKQ